ncbi:AMP-binding protein [Nocardia sp. BMG111209]|uniref:AMP-binding protein n=1 Tax=Nocardia sp. BMG111209 TaxID=1160137 RepID=UPI0003A7F8D3|nr:AMP-binding protein [Nocardia sp. BMG111209]
MPWAGRLSRGSTIITAGERVAVLSRNDTRVLEVIHACAVLGAVAVPLNWRLTESELAGVGADAELALLIHESDSGVLVGELPRNATGTILNAPLREQAAATDR